MTVAAAWARRRTRLEWALALAAVTGSVVVMCWVGRNTWFRLDVFDFLTGREAGSLDSWITPHAGHLQVAAVGLHRLLYGLFGLDFWPWYYLPAILGYAGLSLLLWRVLLRRGADRGVAFAAYLVLLFLGVAAFLSSIAIGGLLVLTLLPLVAERLDGDAVPSALTKVLVAAALLVMVTSSSVGVAGLGGCLLAVTVGGGLRRWWWTFLPGLAFYGAWYLVRADGSGHGQVVWGHLPSMPGDVLRLVGSATTRLVGLKGGGLLVGAAVAGALAAWFGWLAWKRRLRRWDLVFIGALAAYLLMVTLVRGAAGKVPLDIARYSFPIVLLAVPLVVPRVRLPQRWPVAVRAAVLVLAGGSLVVVNAWQRVDQTNVVEGNTARGRVAIETVAQSLARGEPALQDVSLKQDLGIGTAGVLTVADVRGFLADGWDPTPDAQWRGWDAARAKLRLNPVGMRPPLLPAPLASAVGGAPGGCVIVRAQDEQSFTVVGAGEFELQGGGPDGSARVTLVWSDAFGEFSRKVVVRPRVTLAVVSPPEGGAVLTIVNRGNGELDVCGVVPAG